MTPTLWAWAPHPAAAAIAASCWMMVAILGIVRHVEPPMLLLLLPFQHASHFGHCLAVVECIKVAWVVGIEVRWWLHWWLSSLLNLYCICRLSDYLVENKIHC